MSSCGRGLWPLAESTGPEENDETLSTTLFDIGDMVDLDKPIDWVKGQSQEIDGKNYNVYTNSTVKLLIEDDIDVIPDI